MLDNLQPMPSWCEQKRDMSTIVPLAYVTCRSKTTSSLCITSIEELLPKILITKYWSRQLVEKYDDWHASVRLQNLLSEHIRPLNIGSYDDVPLANSHLNETVSPFRMILSPMVDTLTIEMSTSGQAMTSFCLNFFPPQLLSMQSLELHTSLYWRDSNPTDANVIQLPAWVVGTNTARKITQVFTPKHG